VNRAVVAKVVRWLFVIVGALLGVVIVLSLIRGAPLIEMVPLMLVLVMSAVPAALPVMFTVSMAGASKEHAKLGVLVTRLSAAEDAATMDVLCVDKTGTITMNQLAVTGVIPLEHATESDVLFAGELASQEANQDPIDMAFLAAAKERHLFDGLPKATPASGRARPRDGRPALAGLVTLYDPPRPDARQLITTLHNLGVPVKMLTGDALAVASEIARGFAVAESPVTHAQAGT
jgi:magnesium-transporting ATPase (P-type)